MTFDRTSASVDKLQARFGNGTVSGSGHITFGAPATYAIKVNAKGAQLNLPAYGSGAIDADLALTREDSRAALLSGTAQLSNAAIPFAAFLAAAQKGAQSVSPLPPLDLDVEMKAGKNVRVRGSGYGAGLDIGATAASFGRQPCRPDARRQLHGDRPAPSPTIDRAFRVQTAKVTFNPAAGISRPCTPPRRPRSPTPTPDRAARLGHGDRLGHWRGHQSASDLCVEPAGLHQRPDSGDDRPFGSVLRIGSSSLAGGPAVGNVSGNGRGRPGGLQYPQRSVCSGSALAAGRRALAESGRPERQSHHRIITGTSGSPRHVCSVRP